MTATVLAEICAKAAVDAAGRAAFLNMQPSTKVGTMISREH